jgi:hypothetical protein
MPLQLDRAVKMMARLNIRSRDTGQTVPFRLRPQQQRVIAMLKEHQGKGRRLFAIFLKARRVGISTLVGGLQMAHIAAKPDSRAGIIAQTKEVSRELFDQAGGFAEDMRRINPGVLVMNNEIVYPHQNAPDSSLKHYTAATIWGTRGLTLSSIHMTEAAFYPYEGAYRSILNTLSSADPDCLCMIETTANGMEGPGESYYEYWNAAVAGENEFLPIFLPWYEDDAYVADPEMARDAPANDYEKWLMREVKDEITGRKVVLSKEQIAWFRTTLATKCEGRIDVWRAEFPSTPSESFVATGNPAFSEDEMRYAGSTAMEPRHQGMIEINPITLKPEVRFSPTPDFEKIQIWEMPQPHTHYFAGVDTARGNLENKNPGDFAAIVVWNAETGNQAARYAARVSPETLSEMASLVGRFYNDACLNVEINGLGYVVMKELREKHLYPFQHRWKGRDDKFDGRPGTVYGFETTMRSRNMMFNLFRTALYRKSVVIKDKVLLQQMQAAKMEAWRFEISVGHDDVFFAAILGWIALEQMHPLSPCSQKAPRNVLMTADEMAASQLAIFGRSPAAEAAKLTFEVDRSSTALGALLYSGNTHLQFLERAAKKSKVDRLSGI